MEKEQIYNILVNELGYDSDEAQEIIEYNKYQFIEGYSESDLAYYYIDEVGLDKAVPRKDREFYFDFETFGDDLIHAGEYTYVEDAVDVSEFPVPDTARAVFGKQGRDLPNNSDLEYLQELVDLYQQWEQLSGREADDFARKHDFDPDTEGTFYKDGDFYDIETLQKIIAGDYDIKSGYMHYYSDKIVEVSNEEELGKYIIQDTYGDLEYVPEEIILDYFKYSAFGSELAQEFTKVQDGWLRVLN